MLSCSQSNAYSCELYQFCFWFLFINCWLEHILLRFFIRHICSKKLSITNSNNMAVLNPIYYERGDSRFFDMHCFV